MGTHGEAWCRQHQPSFAHSPGQGLCVGTVIPGTLDCSWEVKSLSAGGSAYFGNSHFRSLSLSQPHAHHHTADTTRALISPPSRSPVVPGDPQQHMTPPFQAAIDCQAPSAGAALQTPLPPALGRTSIRQPPFMSSLHPFPGRAPSCSLPRRLLFPAPVILTAPQPLSRGPPASVSPPQSAELGDPAGQHGLGTALPGAGHTWMAKPALPGSVCPHVTLDTPTGCLCLTSPHRDLTLPLWCRQGPTGAPAPAQTPRWFSQLVTVRGGGDDIPAPAKTNTAPSKHAGLGKPTPRPSITHAPSPRQPIRGAEQGRKSRGLGGGGISAIPPRLSQHCQLKRTHFHTLPGAGGSPRAPHTHRALGNVRGSVSTPRHAESAPGRDSSSLGWLCRRVPCSCWLSPRQKVGQSQLQALTIINHAQASICHWAGAGKDQISQTSGGGSVGGRGQSGRSWRGRRGSVLSTVS